MSMEAIWGHVRDLKAILCAFTMRVNAVYGTFAGHKEVNNNLTCHMKWCFLQNRAAAVQPGRALRAGESMLESHYT
jgi:hypothetical protein